MRSLVNGLSDPIDDRKPTARYVCALVSELAYYYVPQWEVDRQKRAKLIPCDTYQMIVAGGAPTNLVDVFTRLELGGAFVVEGRGSIAVGVALNRLLFVGFRGTQFLFDWRVNLRSRLVPMGAPPTLRGPFPQDSYGRLHSGFGEEAMRISSRVIDAVRDSGLGPIDHVFLSGHSLGGAVAAIADNFIRIARSSVCIFGAPRYSDLSAYRALPFGPPTHIRRPGDIMPTVPPRSLGYADHPYESTTAGSTYIDPTPYGTALGGFLRWAQFLASGFRPHSIEEYRRELGSTAHATGARLPLTPLEGLTKRHVQAGV
jgi:hypothetical protein